jgi:hypothetical protein
MVDPEGLGLHLGGVQSLCSREYGNISLLPSAIDESMRSLVCNRLETSTSSLLIKLAWSG